MTSRRQFFMSAAAAGIIAGRRISGARTGGTAFPYTEFEARIAKRDFRDMTKDVLPTPCMVVDLAAFERNLKTMADQVRATGTSADRARFHGHRARRKPGT